MTISERIFELLDKRGMSQKVFAERTGIAQSSISANVKHFFTSCKKLFTVVAKSFYRPHYTERIQLGI